jgi:glucosamine-6-phosphate deaminase
MIDLRIVESAEEGGALAADLIAVDVARYPDLVLGVATGSTPLTTWSALARHRLDMSAVSAVALDEYVGLPAGHPESYRAVVSREIVEPLGLDAKRVHVADGVSQDPAAAADAFETQIRRLGGVGTQVLGIGRNGHIAFNEPGSSFDSRTRVEALTQETRADNARFFSSLAQVPTHCITQGIGTILEAHRIILLAYGKSKAVAIRDAFEGPITEASPASALRSHESVVVIVDRSAAALLTSRG